MPSGSGRNRGEDALCGDLRRSWSDDECRAAFGAIEAGDADETDEACGRRVHGVVAVCGHSRYSFFRSLIKATPEHVVLISEETPAAIKLAGL